MPSNRISPPEIGTREEMAFIMELFPAAFAPMRLTISVFADGEGHILQDLHLAVRRG